MPTHLPLPGLDLGKSAFLKNDTRSLFFDQPASPGWELSQSPRADAALGWAHGSRLTRAASP